MNNLMPQPAPSGQAPMQLPAGQIEGGRQHLSAVMDGLMSLATKPRGSLSKEDVYNAAADMIAQGAFPTPQAKQALVAELVQMPDNEAAIRQAIGSHLMRLAGVRDQFHQQYGEG